MKTWDVMNECGSLTADRGAIQRIRKGEGRPPEARTDTGRTSGRASHLIGQCAVGQCLGEMNAADFLQAVEVGEGARDA